MTDARAKATGIGGVFIYANDAKALSEWYACHLGFNLAPMDSGKTFYQDLFTRSDQDPAKRQRFVFAIFTAETKLPTERREFMANYRVDNLEILLAQFRQSGVEIEKTEDHPYGHFAWVRDPEGNRIELWQPLGEE